MATIQLKEVPEDLLKRLELAAAGRRWDLSREVVDRLDNSFGAVRHAEIRTPEELRLLAKQIRGEGRPV